MTQLASVKCSDGSYCPKYHTSHPHTNLLFEVISQCIALLDPCSQARVLDEGPIQKDIAAILRSLNRRAPRLCSFLLVHLMFFFYNLFCKEGQYS
jgi:hypothetical protein